MSLTKASNVEYYVAVVVILNNMKAINRFCNWNFLTWNAMESENMAFMASNH